MHWIFNLIPVVGVIAAVFYYSQTEGKRIGTAILIALVSVVLRFILAATIPSNESQMQYTTESECAAQGGNWNETTERCSA